MDAKHIFDLIVYASFPINSKIFYTKILTEHKDKDSLTPCLKKRKKPESRYPSSLWKFIVISISWKGVLIRSSCCDTS